MFCVFLLSLTDVYYNIIQTNGCRLKIMDNAGKTGESHTINNFHYETTQVQNLMKLLY